jgi:hypothetical protein
MRAANRKRERPVRFAKLFVQSQRRNTAQSHDMLGAVAFEPAASQQSMRCDVERRGKMR